MDRLRLNAEYAPLLRFPTMRWRRAVALASLTAIRRYASV